MRQAAKPSRPRAGVGRIIERPRLIKLLDEATARTILLVAPAGYGKTTLIRQWSERRPGAYWYTARSGSADVAQLAVDLATALDNRPPKLKDYVSQLVRARPSPADQVAEIVEGFASAAGGAESTSLVIDDYHLLAEDQVAEWFVHELQSRLGFRLVIASRSRPSWATARLEIYGETVEFGLEELALTDDEAQQVLGESPQARGLLSQARGWPAVVALAAQTDKSVSPADAAGSTLFRFFAEELFLATPQKLQDQLLTLALLPTRSTDVLASALGDDWRSVIENAILSGLATHGPDGPEVHPLVREYLFTKLRERDDVVDQVGAAFEVSLAGRFWDHAFDLVENFLRADLLHDLVRTAFKPLLSSGRIATLELISAFAHRWPNDVPPEIALIDAELAFRSGMFERASQIAIKVAQELDSDSPFSSHAWWIAGMATEMRFDDLTAAGYFERAKAAALDEDDTRDALWGLVIAACQSERPDESEALKQIATRRDRSAVDFVRAATAQLYMWRLGMRERPLETERAMHELAAVQDPRIRTGFLNQYAYNAILWGEYDTAYEIAQSLHGTSDEYQLTWALPHAEWALAAAALGRRQFALADTWLRRVEHVGDQLRDDQLVLNASCVRCRMLLALGRATEARSVLRFGASLSGNPAMRGEFMATEALVLALLGELDQSARLASKAAGTTISVEAHAYIACTNAIRAIREPKTSKDLAAYVQEIERLGVWDAFVGTARAWPPLLEEVAAVIDLVPIVVRVLRNSHDFDLARRVGIDLGPRPPTSIDSKLTRREREILELVGQGLTNAEIGRALFIAPATVKAHVRHILEKTDARSRTEAATRRLSGG
jgi:ATP/maltotriose-dependent transcriptional regulator MalT